MFYSEFGFRSYGDKHARTSNYFLLFARHFDQYVNSFLVRSVSIESIVWC
jgi:hypothetical protein